MQKNNLSFCLQYLEQSDVNKILTFSRKIEYKKRVEIDLLEATDSGIYLITEGQVILKSKLLTRDAAIIETLKVGDYFGEVEYYQLSPWDTSYIAEANTTCLFIPRHFLALIEGIYPLIKLQMDKEIARQIRKRMDHIEKRIIKTFIEKKQHNTAFFCQEKLTQAEPEQLTITKDYLNVIKNLPALKNFTQKQIDTLCSLGSLNLYPKFYRQNTNQSRDLAFDLILKGAIQINLLTHNKIAKLIVLGPNNFSTNLATLKKDDTTLGFSTCERALLLTFSSSTIPQIADEPLLYSKLYNLFLQSLVELKNAHYKLYVRSYIEIHHHTRNG